MESIEEIQGLEPKPGRRFSVNDSRYVVPDVTIQKVGEDYVVILNEEGIRANRYHHEFSVLMADVDHFKQYNDEFGHPAGDEVLRRVADILRASDAFARLIGAGKKVIVQ